MSCWRRTTVLRIPAAALGFRTVREWNDFLMEHEDDFGWEPGDFGESMSDRYPWGLGWRDADFDDPGWRLDSRDPRHPDVVPGPFFDYCLEETMPIEPEDNPHSEVDKAVLLSGSEMEEYLPLYRKLFPKFTLKDMEAVRRCEYVWYDGTNSPYLYSDLD